MMKLFSSIIFIVLFSLNLFAQDDLAKGKTLFGQG